MAFIYFTSFHAKSDLVFFRIFLFYKTFLTNKNHPVSYKYEFNNEKPFVYFFNGGKR